MTHKEVSKSPLNLEAYYKAMVQEECLKAGIGCSVFVNRTDNEKVIHSLSTKKSVN